MKAAGIEKARFSVLLACLWALSACGNSDGESKRRELNKPIISQDNNEISDSNFWEESATQVANFNLSSVQFIKPPKEKFVFFHARAGGKAENSSGKVLFTFVDNREKGDKWTKFYALDGKLLGKIQFLKSDNLEIQNEDGKRVFVFKVNEDQNSYTLEDKNRLVLYTMKQNAYGLSVEEGAGGQELFWVKVSDGKVSLKSDKGSTVLIAKADVPAPALACFSMDKLSKAQQYGLAYALLFLKL